jgi:hypothetical protein
MKMRLRLASRTDAAGTAGLSMPMSSGGRLQAATAKTKSAATKGSKSERLLMKYLQALHLIRQRGNLVPARMLARMYFRGKRRHDTGTCGHALTMAGLQPEWRGDSRC